MKSLRLLFIAVLIGFAAPAWGGVTATTATVQWSPDCGDPESGVVSYNVYLDSTDPYDMSDAALIENTDQTTYTYTGLFPSSTYGVSYSCINGIGLESLLAPAFEFTTSAAGPAAIPIVGDCTDEPSLTGRNDIVFCERWESATWYSDHGYVGNGEKTSPPAADADDVSDTRLVSTNCVAGSCLEVDTPKWQKGSLSVRWPMNEASLTPDEMYFRYYIRLGDEWTPQQCFDGTDNVDQAAGKLPGFADTRGSGDPGGQCGNGGNDPSDGTECWSARGGFREIDTGLLASNYPYDSTGDPGDITRLGLYWYLYDDTSSTGVMGLWDKYAQDNNLGTDYTSACRREQLPATDPDCYCNDVSNVWCGTNQTSGSVRTGQWYSVEQYMKMNTPSIADGVARVWLDGELVYEKTNVRQRAIGHDNLHVRLIWLDIYKGGSSGNCETSNIYLDSMVVSTSYIGPTTVAPDTTDPIFLSSPTATPSDTSATISFTTDEATTASIDYGLSTLYGLGPATGGLASSHDVVLSPLDPATDYNYQVTITDAAGNSTVDTNRTFTTDAVDVAAPILSNIVATPAATSATITLDTDEPATCTVDYGLTASYTDSVVGPSLVSSHSILIPSLAGSTTYHYSITCEDDVPNASTPTSDATFLTLSDARPAWHPAANVANRHTGAGKELLPLVPSGGPITDSRRSYGAFHYWTGFSFGDNVVAIDAQGGHSGWYDRSSYRLGPFDGASAPDISALIADDVNDDYNYPPSGSCPGNLAPGAIANNAGRAPADHGYRQNEYVDGFGAVKLGQTATLCQPGGNGHGWLMTLEDDTTTWVERSDGDFDQGTCGDYNPDDQKIWGSRQPSSGAAHLFSIDTTTWQITQHGATESQPTDGSCDVDSSRRMLMGRFVKNGNGWWAYDLDNPNVDPIRIDSLIPSFALKDASPQAATFYYPTLGSNGKWVIWNGGNTFYALEPQGSDFNDYTTQTWDLDTITVTGATIASGHADGGSNTTKRFYSKAGYVRGADIAVIWIDADGYYTVQLSSP